MAQSIPYLYNNVKDILDDAVADNKKMYQILQEKRSLIGEEICAMDSDTLRKKVSDLVDRWDDALKTKGYSPLISSKIKEFNEDFELRRKRLPPVPSVPSGYNSLHEVEYAWSEYSRMKGNLEIDLANSRNSAQSLRKDIIDSFVTSAQESVRRKMVDARSTFSFFRERIKYLYKQIPENLSKFIVMDVEETSKSRINNQFRKETHFVDRDGDIDFVPDFSYSTDPEKDGYIIGFNMFTMSSHHRSPTMVERVSGLPQKAEKWVKENELEAALLDRIRRLVNSLRKKEACEKKLETIDDRLARLETTIKPYLELKRRREAIDKEYKECVGVKGYQDCGAFLVKKGKMQRLGDPGIERIRRGFASEAGIYGLKVSELEDTQWAVFVSSPERVRSAKEDLVKRLVQRCRVRASDAVSLRKQLNGRIKAINAHENYMSRLYTLQLLDPLLNQIRSADQLQAQMIMRRAAIRQSVPLIPTGQTRHHPQDDDIFFPEMVPWMCEGKAANICLEVPAGSGKEAEDSIYKVLDNLLFNMLMAYRPGKVRLHFVDFNLSGRGNFFLVNFDHAVSGSNAVTDDNSFKELLTRLQTKVGAVGKVADQYDVVVILDAPKQLTAQHARALQPLVENGYKGGVSFVAVDTGSRTSGDGSSLLAHESFIHVPLSDEPMMLETLFNSPEVRNLLLKQFSEGMEEAKKGPEIRMDIDSLRNTEFKSSATGLSVPVGERAGKGFNFRLDQVSHSHAFIIGQTGSGKSILMHDIILGACMRYAPEDLRLYLIDLKAGGTEFNDYQKLPHTKAALLSYSDRRIVLQILREVARELESRGELIRNASKVKFDDYNLAFPEKRIPQILIIVDECQRLFSDHPDHIQKEISGILDNIAAMGRAFGIHLVLSTQTLYGSVISAQVRKNITDFYLFKGGAAEGLEDCQNEAAGLNTGEVIYTNRAEKARFQAYKSDDYRESAIKAICDKSKGHPDNGRFVFTGKTVFSLRPEDAKTLRDSRKLSCIAGRTMDIGFEPLTIKLKADLSENIIILGSNSEAADSLALQCYIGMMLSDINARRHHRFFAIDSLNDPDAPYYPLLESLERYGSHLVSGRRRGELIASLASQVRNGTAEPTVVLLPSQERFSPLKRGDDLPVIQADNAPEPSRTDIPAFLQGGNRTGMFSSSRKATYQSELAFLLENGSEEGVHFIWSVDRLSNLLCYDSGLSRKSIMRMFRNILMLRSVSDSVMSLGLPPNEINPEELSDKEDMARAWWIDLLDSRYEQFAPLQPTLPEDLVRLFNNT